MRWGAPAFCLELRVRALRMLQVEVLRPRFCAWPAETNGLPLQRSVKDGTAPVQKPKIIESN